MGSLIGSSSWQSSAARRSRPSRPRSWTEPCPGSASNGRTEHPAWSTGQGRGMYFAHISQTGVVKYGQVPSSIGVLEAPKSPCRSARPTALPGMSTGSRFGRCGSASKNSPADGSSSIVSSSRHSEAASNLYERWAFWSVMPRSSGWNWTIQDMHQFGDSCLCCTGRCNATDQLQGDTSDDDGIPGGVAMGDATGPGKPGSSNAPGDCTPCCRRPPRPRRTARNKRRPKAQRFLMEPRKQARKRLLQSA